MFFLHAIGSTKFLYSFHQTTSDPWAMVMQHGGGHYTLVLYRPVEALDLKSTQYP